MLFIQMRLVKSQILSVASSSFGGKSSAGGEISHLEHAVQHIQQRHFLLAGSWRGLCMSRINVLQQTK